MIYHLRSVEFHVPYLVPAVAELAVWELLRVFFLFPSLPFSVARASLIFRLP